MPTPTRCGRWGSTASRRSSSARSSASCAASAPTPPPSPSASACCDPPSEPPTQTQKETTMTLKVALEALSSDAGVWDDVSTTLGSARDSATGLTVTQGQMSWAADVTGLLQTYEAMRSKTERLLGGGATQTSTIAQGLRTVKTTYEGSDQAAVQRLSSAWTPKDE